MRLRLYDRITDLLAATHDVPPAAGDEVKRLISIDPGDDGLGERPLDQRQTIAVARLLRLKPQTERFMYYIEQ